MLLFAFEWGKQTDRTQSLSTLFNELWKIKATLFLLDTVRRVTEFLIISKTLVWDRDFTESWLAKVSSRKNH
jgi:hypothetical protein